MSFNNRKFNPNIWDTQQTRQVHPTPPFLNQQQNFFPNQGNFHGNQLGNQRFQNSPFQQNQQHVRPLMSLQESRGQDHNQSQFRKYNNNQDNSNYRRPGPACARNNYGNNQRWNRNNNRRDEFNNQDNRQNDSFDSHNNNNNNFNNVNDRPLPFDDSVSHQHNDGQKFVSLVETLKAVQSSKSSGIDAVVSKSASEASQKLMSQLKTMNKDGVKELINNPNPIKKKVINMQAREKLREQMRKKLRRLGDESDANEFQLEPDEAIDYDKIPESLIAQIGRTIDMNIEGDESESLIEGSIEDKDIEVVKKNLGQDFLYGSEMLLMNGFSLLGEADNDPDLKTFDDSMRMPPLPVEKPPSPPPEPVPAPPEEATFMSADKPWSTVPPPPPQIARFVDDEWDLASSRNPDPPEFRSSKVEIPQKLEVKAEGITPKAPDFKAVTPKAPELPGVTPKAPEFPTEANHEQTPKSEASHELAGTSEVKSEKPDLNKAKTSVDDEWDQGTPSVTPAPTKPAEDDPKPDAANDMAQRANETYGDYRRRMAELNKANDKDPEPEVPNNDSEKPAFVRNTTNTDRWGNPIRRNNQNNFRNDSNRNQQNRKSRNEMERGRDLNFDNLHRRNVSRDTNRSHDSGRGRDDVKDAHNYRYQGSSRNDSQEPDINRLNSMLNPKPLQFKGSFNTRQQPSFGRRSRSRNRTPVNNSMERDFSDQHLLPPLNDARPCYYMLNKLVEKEVEITKYHEKVHGIDKVIANLQLERVSYQKILANLQHDRKILFDNLLKRATANDETDVSPKEHSRERSTVTAQNQKPVNEKKAQNMVEPKKRKAEEVPEEPKKKKPSTVEPLESTSAAVRAAQRQKEKEEEERRQRIQEKKRLRREREEAEKARLEEKIRQEAAATTKMTVKEKPIKEEKKPIKEERHSKKHERPKERLKEPPKILFMKNEILQVHNFNTKKLKIPLKKVPLAASLAKDFESRGSLEIDISDWNNWSDPPKSEAPEAKKDNEEPAKSLPPSEDPIISDDPLAMEDTSMNPPTPGSNLMDDSMSQEVPSSQDFSEWTGEFNSHDHPIVHIQNINEKFVVCASEGGKVYKYRVHDGHLDAVFDKHTEICNGFLYDNKDSIYTVSSDGYLHKINFKDFSLVSSENFNEPLQVIEQSRAGGIYVGAKKGRIFKLKSDLTERDGDSICDVGAMILCMRAMREGSRNILLVSSRTNGIQVRDANDGLLLRTLSDSLRSVCVYDMLIDKNTIYCGSNSDKIYAVDFNTGALTKTSPCGVGTISLKLYKNQLVAACYDGNIYIFNTETDEEAMNVCGPSNMLLAMDLWGKNIIASTKDKTLKIMSIPMRLNVPI